MIALKKLHLQRTSRAEDSRRREAPSNEAHVWKTSSDYSRNLARWRYSPRPLGVHSLVAWYLSFYNWFAEDMRNMVAGIVKCCNSVSKCSYLHISSPGAHN